MKNNNKIILLIFLLIVTTAFGIEWKMFGPNARRSSSMIVDSLNQRIILFGGTSDRLNGLNYNDVWEIPIDTSQGYFWRKLSISGNSPAPRCDHSAIYDIEHHWMIVFGGHAGNTLFNDVWALNLSLGSENWTQLTTSGTSPTPRYNFYSIYHPERKSLIIFGGADYSSWLNDVWELKLDSMIWRQITITGNPPNPWGAGGEMFDRANNRMIIFGGTRPGISYNELWALVLTPGDEHWEQLYPTGSIPSARADFAFGCNSTGNKLYVFGGWHYPNFPPYYNDLHILDLSTLTWTYLPPSGDLPTERRNPTGVYDFFNDNFFVFGGDQYYDIYFGETFFIHLGSLGAPEWQSQTAFVNYPTLFVNTIASGSVRIHYTLPKICNINIKILDATGRIIRTLFTGKISSQSDWLTWDTKTGNSQTVSSGVYYCMLETDDTNISKKFIIAK